MLKNVVTVGVYAVLNALAVLGIWATAVVLGNNPLLGIAEGAMMIVLSAVNIAITLRREGQAEKAR